MDETTLKQIVNKILILLKFTPKPTDSISQEILIKNLIQEHTESHNLDKESIKKLINSIQKKLSSATYLKNNLSDNIFRPLVEGNSDFNEITPTMEQNLFNIAKSCQQELTNLIDIESISNIDEKSLKKSITKEIPNIIKEKKFRLNKSETQALTKILISELLGLGYLDLLINNPLISDILINDIDKIYVEINGVLRKTSITFHSQEQLITLMHRIAYICNKKINQSTPYINGALPNGSRINIIIPPLTKSPTFSIRLFNNKNLSLTNLIQNQTLSSKMASFLTMAVNAKSNIIISGSTGSGKTTLLNSISWAIPDNERIITIEDTAELTLNQPNIVNLITKDSNSDKKMQITQRDLLINALRMRPDRIIVGEVRGPEAFELLQAMNTGHDGAISSIHANSASNVITRIANMISTANLDINEQSIKAQLYENIDIIVQIEKTKKGSKLISSISQVNSSEEKIKIEHLFQYTNNNGNLSFEKTNVKINTKLTHKFNKAGLLSDYNNLHDLV